MSLLELHESKRGAAMLLRRAADELEAAGVSLGAVRDALCEVSAAKIALQGCERHLEKMDVGPERPDWKMVAAGDAREAQVV